MSRTSQRIEVFQEPPDVRALSFEEALISDLQPVSTRVSGIESTDALHELFYSQAARMLSAYDPEITGDQLHFSLRFLGKTVKNECQLFQGSDANYITSPVTLQTVYPYVPQYGYSSALEAELGIPTRISFGLWRELRSKTDPTNQLFLFARTNLWLMTDPRNHWDKPFLPMMAKKDVHSFDFLEDEASIEQRLYSPQRSKRHNVHIFEGLGKATLAGLKS